MERGLARRQLEQCPRVLQEPRARTADALLGPGRRPVLTPARSRGTVPSAKPSIQQGPKKGTKVHAAMQIAQQPVRRTFADRDLLGDVRRRTATRGQRTAGRTRT